MFVLLLVFACFIGLSGAQCECSGVKGTCVPSSRCLTTLDTTQDSQCSTACEKNAGEATICCTDCSLVNDTRNVIVSPLGDKLLWKDGRKSRDRCLDFLSRLPYKCKDIAESGVHKNYDSNNQCHNYTLTTKVATTTKIRNVEYPFYAQLGYVKSRATLRWTFMGAIISERFILTEGYAASHTSEGELRYIAANVVTDSFLNWSVYKVKRIILHPEYKNNYNSIALIETQDPIQFNENVLPLCLPTEDIVIENAKLVTRAGRTKAGLTITYPVKVRTKEVCEATIEHDSYLAEGYNHSTQICAFITYKNLNSCKSFAGEPLVASGDIPCVTTVLGLVGFCHFGTQTQGFTRVSHFVPWIESIVWPD